MDQGQQDASRPYSCPSHDRLEQPAHALLPGRLNASSLQVAGGDSLSPTMDAAKCACYADAKRTLNGRHSRKETTRTNFSFQGEPYDESWKSRGTSAGSGHP